MNRIAIIMTTLIAFSPLTITEAQEAYRPPYSKQQSIDTIIIHADGTHERIMDSYERIETELGVKEYGERTLSYNSALEELNIIEAASISVSGESRPVDERGIRSLDDGGMDGAPMFSETKRKVIVYPNLSVGSLLYLKARSRQHTPHFKSHFFLHEVFSPHIQYADIAYHVIVHPDIPLYISAKGMEGGRVEQDVAITGKGPAGYRHYYFTFQQDHAYPTEHGQVHYSHFGSHLMLTTFKDYADVGLAYENYASEKTRITSAVSELAAQVTAGIHDPSEQVKALYHWVSQNIRYVAIYFGDGGFEPHDVDEILKNRYGDCKDHVVLLKSLLLAKGIESSPALVNLGSSDHLSEVAVPFPLNHVILFIPALNLYLDPTAQFSSFRSLPEALLNKPVVLTSLGRTDRTPRMIASEHRTDTKVSIQMLPDGTLQGVSSTSYLGSPEMEARSQHFSREGRSPEQNVQRLLARFREVGFGVIKESDPTNITSAYVFETRFQLESPVNIPGPSAMMIPVGLSPGRIASIGYSKPTPARRFPAQCTSEEILEEYEIKLPVAMKVFRVPQGVSYTSDSICYDSKYDLVDSPEGGVLHVSRKLSMNYVSNTCTKEELAAWDSFHPTLSRDVRSQIFFE